MGAYSLTNFTAYLTHRLGARTDLATPTDHLTRYVNMAYKRLATSDKMWEVKQRFYFPELEVITSVNTTDGNPYILTPSDCLVIRELFDTTNSVRLDWLSWPEYVGKTDRFDTTAEGTPSYWHRRGTRIYLYPTPGAVYSINVDYKKRVSSLDGATYVTTILGEEWDDVILEMATYIAWYELNQPDKAKEAKANAKEMIAERIGTYSAEEQARRERVQPDPTWNARSGYDS